MSGPISANRWVPVQYPRESVGACPISAHEGLAHFTPEEVFTGAHVKLLHVRQRALDDAYERHPERFVNGRPQVNPVPAEVWINRPPSPSGGSPSAVPATQAPKAVTATPRRLELVTS
jgi:hypothetical protein